MKEITYFYCPYIPNKYDIGKYKYRFRRMWWHPPIHKLMKGAVEQDGWIYII